jgi:hypothetical protein
MPRVILPRYGAYGRGYLDGSGGVCVPPPGGVCVLTGVFISHHFLSSQKRLHLPISDLAITARPRTSEVLWTNFQNSDQSSRHGSDLGSRRCFTAGPVYRNKGNTSFLLFKIGKRGGPCTAGILGLASECRTFGDRLVFFDHLERQNADLDKPKLAFA